MDQIEVLISEKDVLARIKELAAQISGKYEGKKVVAVGILNGAVYFLSELTRQMTIPVEIDFMLASSYGAGTVSSGHVMVKKDLDRSIEDKYVLLVEDVVDTGRTLKLLKEMLAERNPAGIEICALLDKPSRREVELSADYIGFEIPDAFVVGWGLDYDQKYRNLPYVGVVKNI